MPTVKIEDGTKDYWTTVRTLSSQAAESSVPGSGSFITLDFPDSIPEEVEIRCNAITITGSPTAVIFKVWRFLGSRIDRVANITTDAADVAAPSPGIVRFDGSKLWVTVDFTGGTAPTASTLIEYRVVK